MKILIFTDSHSYNVSMACAVEREAPDMVLHLGDHTDDARELQSVFPRLTVCAVRGNNDYFDREVPEHAVVTPDGVRIFLTHGHQEQVYVREGKLVAQLAREEGCGLAFFGHTHRMYLKRVNGVLVCNPGSISLPRGGPASYGRLTVENGQPRLLELVNEDGKLLGLEKFGQ
ncbi:metallophosphoesterase [Agathobaculum sp. Marseille-P7918]|uniref:metallophosphoesterase family protein n=1 Tax=Agathobaculum sp. Marseille-P7918 TaxID=2479843 RepID=UPI0035624F9B